MENQQAQKVEHIVRGTHLGVQLIHSEKRCEVGSVGVCENQHQERIGGCDEARWKRMNFEHIDGECVRDTVPKRLRYSM